MSNTERNTTFLENMQKSFDKLMSEEQNKNEQVRRQYEQAMSILQAVEAGYKKTIQDQQEQIQDLQAQNQALHTENQELQQIIKSLKVFKNTLDELENYLHKSKQT